MSRGQMMVLRPPRDHRATYEVRRIATACINQSRRGVVSAEAATTERYDQLLAAISERAAAIGSRPLASIWSHLRSAYRRGGPFLVGRVSRDFPTANFSISLGQTSHLSGGRRRPPQQGM